MLKKTDYEEIENDLKPKEETKCWNFPAGQSDTRRVLVKSQYQRTFQEN